MSAEVITKLLLLKDYFEIPKLEEHNCFVAFLITLSYLLVAITFPFSLVACLKVTSQLDFAAFLDQSENLFCWIKVVQEYERAVIYRLGRNLSGGAKGPGLFFVLPCIDDITTIDLRTVTFDVPPQEILTKGSQISSFKSSSIGSCSSYTFQTQ